MSTIGKEKAQSGLSEAHYMAAITAIMTKENGDMSNWDVHRVTNMSCMQITNSLAIVARGQLRLSTLLCYARHTY